LSDTGAAPLGLSPPQLATLHRQILSWFAQHARPLPWRATRDAYRIWVSEIMLQQTQVATVIDYYHRFLQWFPNVAELAAADPQRVLQAWEGLGYYRRARQLQAAAQQICQLHAGHLPTDRQQLQALPGIGRYTAAAILSFAHDLPEAILEANTFRLLARLSGLQLPVDSTAGQKALWRLAEQLVPPQQAGNFNQALMELGSLVCRPTQPLCASCPLRNYCQAYQRGEQLQLPIKKPPPKITVLQEAVWLCRRSDGRWLLRQHLPEERWAGLWDLPRTPIASAPPETPSRPVELLLADFLNPLQLSAEGPPEHFHRLTYPVTRYRIEASCYVVSLQPLGRGRRWPTTSADGAPLKWLATDQLDGLPLSSSGRRVVRKLAADELRRR
jgi:A/G-specific adenine glycosylase